MINKRYGSQAAIALGAISFLVVGIAVRFPSDPLHLCQKNLFGGFDMWKEASKTNVWPNVGGDSAKSFAEFEQHISLPGDHTYATAYGYVPGLRTDDPPDLIFVYLKRMTRRTWHGDHSSSVFAARKWMIIGPNFLASADAPGTCPEGGVLVDTAEFKRRLQKTRDFLKEQRRANWEAIVAEQGRVLNTIERGAN